MLSITKSRKAGKSLTQTLFFFLLVSQICYPQWYQQNSGTYDNLSSVHFEDANIGWAVSYGGALLHTSDGGNNWYTQADLGAESRSVFFTSPTNGWVVGWAIPIGGFIKHTTDGGNNWSIQAGFAGVTSIFFTSTTTGWVVGDNGIILSTTDGGNIWIEQSSGTTLKLHSVYFIDQNIGWAVGGGGIAGGGGIILNTTDGGINWSEQQFTSSRLELYSVYFTSSTTGWAVGIYWDAFGQIFNTTDGGNNWTDQTWETISGLHSVYFTSSTTGWAVGDYGTILNTTDGGNNWTWIAQSSGTTNNLHSVYFIDQNIGWVVGDYGTILNTTNGGLPVELTSFTAATNGKEVILNWSTATEINNQLFEVQRSFEGSDFATVGFVNGKGTTTERQYYTYRDKILADGKYHYRLKQIDYLGSYEYSDVIEIELRVFNLYLLEQNYPNPFNPVTTIGYGIKEKSNVKITVLNSIGEEVAMLVNEGKESGYHTIEFNASALPSGVYFYQLKSGDFINTKKMILLK
jgi:photosystem II stability/assembly factor-like uncharacterized protein